MPISTHCQVCNKPFEMKVYNRKTCGQKECVYALKNAHMIGKKKPQHSVLMKQYYDDGRFPEFEKNQSNPELNSDNFKKAVLTKKGIPFTSESVTDVYGKLQKEKFATLAAKMGRVASAINAHPNHPLSVYMEAIIKGIDDSEFDKLYQDKLHGLITSITWESRGKKKIEVVINGKTTLVRSQYEKRYIEFFEENNIKWEYEPKWFMLGRCTYMPDFFIEFEDRKIWVEVKGAFWGHQTEEVYMTKKIIPFVNQLPSTEEFILTFDSKPTHNTFRRKYVND